MPLLSTTLEPRSASADRRRPRRKFAALGVLTLVATAVLHTGTSGAATTVELGTAESFGVLGASTVTNTGPTTIDGDLGVRSSAPDALTGFDDSNPPGPGQVDGATHSGDQTAEDAQADALIAYGGLSSQPCDDDLSGSDLGGLTLEPGVYCFSSEAGLTGALTLNALADPAAVFVIRVASALTTATASRVQFTNDFASCNVFWQVGSSATLGTETDFVGTLIAHTSVTAVTDASVMGRLIALNGAVTLDSNVITATSCATEDDTSTTVVDEPVDGTPVGGQVAQTPVGGSPSAAVPVGDASSPGLSGGAPAIPATTTGGPLEPGLATGAPLVPGLATGSPGVPALTTGGPFVPGLTGGPGVPHGSTPPLPVTGSNLMLGAFGGLAILLGAGLVLVADPKRMRPHAI